MSRLFRKYYKSFKRSIKFFKGIGKRLCVDEVARNAGTEKTKPYMVYLRYVIIVRNVSIEIDVGNVGNATSFGKVGNEGNVCNVGNVVSWVTSYVSKVGNDDNIDNVGSCGS